MHTEIEQDSWASSLVSLADFSDLRMCGGALFPRCVTGLGPVTNVRPGFLFLESEGHNLCLSKHSIIDVGGNPTGMITLSSESGFGCSVQRALSSCLAKKCNLIYGSEIWGIVPYAQYALVPCSNDAQTFLIVVKDGWHDSHR